ALRACTPSRLGVALAASQARTSARNWACSGVSLKSMINSSGCQQLLDQTRFPPRLPAQLQGQQLRATVMEVAVELPGKTHAAVGLDVFLGGVVVRIDGADPCSGRRQRQLRRISGQRPGRV